MHKVRILNILLYDASLIALGPRIELIGNVVFDLLQIVEHFNAVTPIGILSRLDDPPGVLLVVALELLKLLVLKDVLTVHLILQVDDVGFWHHCPGRFLEGRNRVVFHVAVKLALRCKLVDAVDVVVDLVWKQLLEDL